MTDNGYSVSGNRDSALKKSLDVSALEMLFACRSFSKEMEDAVRDHDPNPWIRKLINEGEASLRNAATQFAHRATSCSNVSLF